MAPLLGERRTRRERVRALLRPRLVEPCNDNALVEPRDGTIEKPPA